MKTLTATVIAALALQSAVASLTAMSAAVGGGDIYVATNGLDTNPGTLAQPTTLSKAITLVPPGGTIFMRGGTYIYSAQITLERTNNGAGELLRKSIFAYPAEQPVLDFSSQPYGKTSRVHNSRGLQINGHWWHLRGLEVKGSADNGIYVAGNSNIIERCITHHNRDTGLQIGRHASTVAHADWPAYNLILNCDSYDNYDSPPNGGENADGFACKLTSGPGNVFRGCVAHNNTDDGWDLFTKRATGPIDPVIIDQCVAYANGVLTDGTINKNGDRNGFKLGGSSIAVDHVVTRSIAFSNLHNGFTWNSNPGRIRMVNNLAFDNTKGNYKFDVEGPLFFNNLSFWKSLASDQSDRRGASGSLATRSNCWWDKSKKQPSISGQGLIVTAGDFVSLAPPAGGFTRNADGTLNLGDFGRLAASSPLIGAGDAPVLPNLGKLPFIPATYYLGIPDIGAVESGPQ